MLDVNIDSSKCYPIKIGEQQPSQLLEIKTVLHVVEKNFWGIKSKPKGNYWLKVVDINPGNLILSNDELIKILDDGKTSSEMLITLSDYKTPITLLLDSNVIQDYNRQLDHIRVGEDTTEVSFRLQLADEKEARSIIFSEYVLIKIKIEKPTIKLISSIKLANNGEIDYDPTCSEKIQIGQLLLSHNKSITCMPELNTKFIVSAASISKEYRELISLDMTRIKESNPILAEGTDITIYGTNTSVIQYDTVTIANQRKQYSLTHIKSGNITNFISIPILFDMSKIQNPAAEILDIFIEIQGEDYGLLFGESFNNTISQKVILHLNKNKIINDLKVECINCDGRTVTVIPPNTYECGEIILSTGFENVLTLKLQNTATAIDSNHENACILVSHIQQTLITEDIDRVIFTNGNTNADAYFRFNVPETYDTAICKLYPAQHACDSEMIFQLLIKASDIKDIRKTDTGCYKAFLNIHIELDYAVCLSGGDNDSDLNWQHYSADIGWSLEQVANPEWLSVDFGTSAIVASYASDAYHITEKNLLNLNGNKAELHRRTYGDAPQKTDILSEPAPFIPSTISFNSNTNNGDYSAERSDADYKTFPIWLSPSTGMKDIMLPCLKTLVGYKTIPNIFTDEESRRFRYQIENETVSLFDENGRIVERGLSYVNAIIEEVYKQLFRYFICLDSADIRTPNPIQKNNLHKLVLSVPNTFTPVHHNLIKGIAQRYFPNLRSEYLQIVNESDAVACYYLANWRQLFSNVDKNIVRQLENEENVLVYDMGAGTLDLTYFEKTRSNNEVIIHIKGKLGMNKAGNYLDYLIAEILSNFVEDRNRESYGKLLVLDKAKRITDSTLKKDCEDLKTFVKDTIKPLLNNPEAAIPDYKNFTFGKHIIQDILDHEKYGEYIEECTNKVLDNMISSSCRTEGLLPGHRSARDTFPIDVVVFSGRSTALKGIRESISKYIREKRYENVLCADLTTNSVNPIENASDTGASTNNLKTVVTYGSLIYADMINRRSRYSFSAEHIFASYGFLAWNVPNHEWEWKELITPSSQQNKVSQAKPDVASILYNESIHLQMEDYQQLIFIQTYSNEPALDWTNGNKDLTMPILYYTIPNGTDGIRLVSMSIDSNNTIICNIEGVGKIELEPHDDFENMSLRKSLWPVVF